MKFVNKSGNKRIDIIVKKLNDEFEGERFKQALVSLPKDAYGNTFKKAYTSSVNVTGEYIWQRLQEDPSIIEVFTYWNYFTKANGYTLNDGKAKVWLNTAKFGRSDASIAATLAHEAVHEADNNDPAYFYHHGVGKNANTPKGGTAPEVIGDIMYLIMAGVPSTQSSAI